METTKLIEEYLCGTLNEPKRKQFEERLAGDSELSRLYELHKEVNEGIRDQEFHQFRSLVKQVDADYFEAQHESLPVEHPLKPAFRYKSMLQYAALFLVLVGTAAILRFTFFTEAKPGKLFDQYYTPYNTDIVMRSTQTEGTALENAIVDYGRGDYSAALQKLDDLISENQGNHVAWFYKGLACLALDETPEAIRSFRVIEPDWNHPLLEHRTWYLALALLHNSNTEEAVAVFNDITEHKGYYAERAVRIIRKLGS
ncbi:MAG: hypothetical protein R6X09_10415 [Bacteroidales bacterium]